MEKLMKNIEDIQAEIDRLEKINLDLEEQYQVALKVGRKQAIKINISQNKVRIKTLEWVKGD